MFIRLRNTRQERRASRYFYESGSGKLFALMQTLVEYRGHPINNELQKMRRKHSMLHLDVLTAIYHFAKIGSGHILEIGPYLGGSAIAAAYGVRDSGQPKTIITIEPGGRCDHPTLPTT